MYLTMWFAQIKQSAYRVQPIWSYSLQYSSPFLSSCGIRPIGFVNKSNTAIFKETVMIIWREMLKHKWLHMFLSSFGFPIIYLYLLHLTINLSVVELTYCKPHTLQVSK